jgi:hypothetical protein
VFFLFGVDETARASAAVFRSVLSLKQRIEQDVLPRFSARRQGNAQALMRQLYVRPIIDVKGVAGMPGMAGVSTNTAAALIADMVASGVLHEVTGQRRNRLFVFRDYLDIFRQQP